MADDHIRPTYNEIHKVHTFWVFEVIDPTPEELYYSWSVMLAKKCLGSSNRTWWWQSVQIVICTYRNYSVLTFHSRRRVSCDSDGGHYLEACICSSLRGFFPARVLVRFSHVRGVAEPYLNAQWYSSARSWRIQAPKRIFPSRQLAFPYTNHFPQRHRNSLEQRSFVHNGCMCAPHRFSNLDIWPVNDRGDSKVLLGRRVLIVDEVDDSRTTLQFV